MVTLKRVSALLEEHGYKQFLDEVFVISRIIKVEVGVISRSRSLGRIILAGNLLYAFGQSEKR